MILKVVIFYALQSADAVKRNIKSVPLMNRILTLEENPTVNTLDNLLDGITSKITDTDD